MNNQSVEIGYIVSVNGNTVSVQLEDTIQSNMPIVDGVVYRIGQIGSFLKIPLGYSNLFGIVTATGAAAIPVSILNSTNPIQNYQYLNLTLVGEQIGKRFIRGVSQSPTTGDKVFLVTSNDLKRIYGDYVENNSVVVGHVSNSEYLEARIDIDKLITRHCAILGSTGSGKSNAVGVLLNSITSKGYKSARILVIDPHGEYNNALQGKSLVFQIRADEKETRKELFIPYWALPFDELLSVFSRTLSDQNREYVRKKIEEAKQEGATNNKINIRPELITADSPIPFSIKQLWFDLDNVERQTLGSQRDMDTVTVKTHEGNPLTLDSNLYPPPGIGSKGPFLSPNAKGILPFLNSMRLKLLDRRFSFMFEPGDYLPDLSGKVKHDLNQLLWDWLKGGEKPVAILDLSGIPAEIMESIAGSLLRIIYDSLFWGQSLQIGGKQQPLFIVLEEAHNYLRAGENSIASRTIQTIAKEGRKYGVGLALVTQRPSELDETVLSQCGTIIALRMNNSKDRSFIHGAMSDDLQTIVDLLPTLRVGEGIISGEAVKIPTRVQFNKLSNAIKGSDPKVTECWGEEKNSTIQEYSRLVNNWRNQIIKESNE